MTDVFISINDIKFETYKWIDARFSLKDINEGKRKYEAEHVQDAVHWDLNDSLSDMSKNDGRQPMPDKEFLVELFRSSGLLLEDSVVVYDDGGSPFATRAWWFLQYAGFKNSFIVVEGFDEIKAAGIPCDQGMPAPVRTSVIPLWDEAIYASRDFVEETVAGETKSVLLDARAANRYRGEIEPLDRIAGHIPGALNFDWEQLKKDGDYFFDETIQKKLAEVAAPSEEITVYCGSGVTASPLYAMLKHYGYANVRLYIGSYSDWVSKTDASVEKA